MDTDDAVDAMEETATAAAGPTATAADFATAPADAKPVSLCKGDGARSGAGRVARPSGARLLTIGGRAARQA